MGFFAAKTSEKFSPIVSFGGKVLVKKKIVYEYLRSGEFSLGNNSSIMCILYGGGGMTIEKRKKFIVNFLFFAIWVLIAFVVLRYGVSALKPFVLAVVLSYILKRPIQFLMRKLKLPRKWAAIIVVLIFYSTVGLLVSLLFIRALSEVVSIVVAIPKLYEQNVSPVLISLFGNLEQSIISQDASLTATLENLLEQFVKSIGEIISDLSMSVVGYVSDFTASLPGLFIEIVLLIISTFFITIDYDKLAGFIFRQLSPKAKTTFVEVKEYVVGTLFVCIRSYALIMSITFVELSFGLTLLRIENAVLIAFLIAMFDILPVLGTGGIMLPWVGITVLQGDYSLALGLLLVYVAITVIRNIIEPKIVGKQIGLHPILTLSSMYLGVQLFGVIGLFGFPIGLSLLGHLNSKGIIKVYKTEKENGH